MICLYDQKKLGDMPCYVSLPNCLSCCMLQVHETKIEANHGLYSAI
jgi:hypothetical protein